MKKRAFTLIELLVVIAIIAILAAILFPVFAQAKMAAKATASISNEKQIALGALMYSADYDDIMPLAAAVTEPTGPWNQIKPWSLLMIPYIKSGQIFYDPLRSPYNPTGWNPIDSATFFSQHAYAWQVHSPGIYYGGSYLTWGPLSQTQLGNPADTVLMFTKRSGNVGPQWWWGAGMGIVTWFTAGVPYCSGGYTQQNPQSLCGPGLNSWGYGSISGSTGNETPAFEGYNTGGFAYAKSGRGIVSLADGHVVTMAPGQAAAGTNWAPTIPQASLVINDSTKYKWDAN